VIKSPLELHYDLALRLHRSAADVELCFGDFAKGEAFCRVLIANTTSTREKLRIKLNLAHAFGQIERYKEAMNVHLDALYSINALPKRFHLAWALREYAMVRSLLKKYADHEVYALPPMTDENTLSAMEHMSALMVRAFLCGNIVTNFLCILRQISTTFKHGLCAESANETFRCSFWFWSRLQLAYYFGELEIACKMYYLYLKVSAVDTSYITTSIRIFFSGLAASGLYRKTKKRMYRIRAKRR
jgi:hypothetical protein